MTDEHEATENPLPEGDYAIVECMGHRTMVGRVEEVEYFGGKLCAVEPIWEDGLLPAVLIGAGSIYCFTPSTRDVAWARQAKHRYQLPSPIQATLPETALPAPVVEAEAHEGIAIVDDVVVVVDDGDEDHPF